MNRNIEVPANDPDLYAPTSASYRAHLGPLTSDFAMFLGWEKLRLLYNAIIGLETIFCMIISRNQSRIELPLVIPGLIWVLIIFNVCYCVGPVLNGYANMIGIRGPATMYALFSVVTSFAALALLSVFLIGPD